MSEEEIITETKFVISWIAKIGLIRERDAIKGLLDLYYKQQKELETLRGITEDDLPF